MAVINIGWVRGAVTRMLIATDTFNGYELGYGVHGFRRGQHGDGDDDHRWHGRDDWR